MNRSKYLYIIAFVCVFLCLWIACTQDAVVPVEHALEMKAQIPTALLILYRCGHSDGPPDWAVYWQDIYRFLKDAGLD
jgi:hypothetical protein